MPSTTASAINSTIKLLSGGYGGRIDTLSFNPITSNLSIMNSIAGGVAPTWLTFNENHSIVYACDEWGDDKYHHGNIKAFKISSIDNSLSLLSTTTSSGAWPCHSILLPKYNRLIISNYGGSIISSIPISNSTGALETDISKHQIIFLEGTSRPLGPNKNRQDKSHPHQIVLDPTGEFILVPDLGTDEIRLFRILSDEQAEEVERGVGQGRGGELKMEKEMNLILPAGSGPRHLLFTTSPSGSKLLYVLNELSNSISVYLVSYSSSSDSTSSIHFTLLQCSISTLPPQPFSHQTSFSTWHLSELILSPSNSAIFCSNRAEDIPPLESSKEGPSDLFFISKLSSEGLLIPNKSKLISSGGRTPRHFSLSPIRKRLEGEEKGSFEDDVIEEGRYLAVGLQDSDIILIYKREEMKIVARLENAGRPGIILWI